MNRYPDQAMEFFDLCKRSFRLHYVTLRHTIFFIIFITLIKFLAVQLHYFSASHPYLDGFLYWVFALIIAYFFSAAVLATHAAFLDKSQTPKMALLDIWRNKIPVFATLAAYLIGFYFIIELMDLLHKLLGHAFPDPTVLHGLVLFFTAVFTVMYIGMFCFSYPLSILEKQHTHKAFYASLVLSEGQKFNIFVLFIFLVSVLFLVTPNTIPEYFLSAYHLNIIYDFVVLCVMLPLFINFLLLVLNNAKLSTPAEDYQW